MHLDTCTKHFLMLFIRSYSFLPEVKNFLKEFKFFNRIINDLNRVWGNPIHIVFFQSRMAFGKKNKLSKNVSEKSFGVLTSKEK